MCEKRILVFFFTELIDGMHRGEFPEDIKELKVCSFDDCKSLTDLIMNTFSLNLELFDLFLQCFTLCIAESAGTVNSINFNLFNFKCSEC